MEKKLSKEERLEQGQIHARFIIEMLGAPKEHIEKTIRDYVEKLKADPLLTINSESFSEAKSQDKFFSVYVELDMWVKNVNKVVEFCFDALPSSIEIQAPQQLTFQAPDFSGLMNDLQAKIHDYDFKLKDLVAKNKMLAKNSSSIMKNFIFLAIHKESKTLDEIGSLMGIKPSQLKPFVDIMVEKKEIELEGNKYRSLVR
tara:strand:+ start:2720 stop:3319 length:600 start_codon:yes stop_codon:yes gene_type:complete